MNPGDLIISDYESFDSLIPRMLAYVDKRGIIKTLRQSTYLIEKNKSCIILATLPLYKVYGEHQLKKAAYVLFPECIGWMVLKG